MQTLKFLIGICGLIISATVHASLQETIRSEVESAIDSYQLAGRITVQHPKSPRLDHLEPCSKVQIENVSQTTSGAVRFQVNCANWQIFWPVTIHQWLPTVVLNNDIARNQAISRSDVSLREQNITNLRQGYFSDIAQVIEKQAQRNLTAGMTLNARLIAGANLVARNDKVVIIARKQSLQVSMNGTSLQNGSMGEQVRVKNASSGRVISATVIGEKVVEVTLAP